MKVVPAIVELAVSTALDTVDALLTSLESDAKNDLSLVDIATIE